MAALTMRLKFAKGIQGPRGEKGVDGKDGIDGIGGVNGWTPIIAVVEDGMRRVQQVIDWTGGTGIKPQSGLYVGSTGLTPHLVNAIDLRGASGSGIGDLLAENALSEIAARGPGAQATARGNIGLSNLYQDAGGNVSITGNGNFSLTGSMFLSGVTKGIEFGAVGVPNSPYFDWHSGAAATDFDARIQAAGGTNESGGGSLYFTAKQLIYLGQIIPGADNAYSLGSLDYRFKDLYAANGVIQTSDRRDKTDIVNIPIGLDFVKALRPKFFRWKDGGNEVEIDPDPAGGPTIKTTPKPGKRTHCGLIAQDVKAALDAAGIKDLGLFVQADPNDPESAQALRIDQLVPILIKAIQELSARVDQLEAERRPSAA